jgi:hypothetical protein
MVQDPFGHIWSISAPISEERTAAAKKKWDEWKWEMAEKKKRAADSDAGGADKKAKEDE